MDHLGTVIVEAHRLYVVLIPPAVGSIYIEVCYIHRGIRYVVPKLHEKIVVIGTESNIVADTRYIYIRLLIQRLS